MGQFDLTAEWASGKGQKRMATLRLLGEAWVPGLDAPADAAPDVAAFWRTSAADRQVEKSVAATMDSRLNPDDRRDLIKLLDVLGLLIPRRASRQVRTRLLKAVSRSADIRRGLQALRALTLMHHYGDVDGDGRNPSWAVSGYPGPPATPLPPGPRMATVSVSPDVTHLVLEADACVVGSGAGGGVIAAALAEAGLDVVVLEMGGHHEESDFKPYELDALRTLYWRGGYTPCEDGLVNVIAGSTLGGGTTVNWMNCVQPPPAVRQQWAAAGLKGLDTGDFDRHLDAVAMRIKANTDCSDHNGPNARLSEGAAALGWSWRVAARNADPATYSPETAGHMGFGDRSGSKQGTLRTYLRDAVAAGARVVVGAKAETVTTAHGQTTGISGTITTSSGALPLTVHAKTVVLACGALETPALLLRSGVGGAAVGRNLHLHPVDALVGLYDRDQAPWWGAPQTVIVDEHRDLQDGFGFLLETPHFGTGVSAASLPWRDAREHRSIVASSRRMATFIGVIRDRGAGQVTVNQRGEAVVHYPLNDNLDQAHLRRALEAMARAHAAAGAEEILDLSPTLPRWRQGDDLESFIAQITQLPMGVDAGGRPLFSAHQMGTARMGTDPADSVADPEGQLHDVRGVWIGDTSAFPSAVGSNPMLTCMALARRTADAILAARAVSVGA